MARNILVVEDDRNISELIRMYLEKEGFEVRLAYDGGKAVEEYDKRAPDMVLLDIMLPVMDGWGVCAHIREKGKTPIIMLTAKSDVGDRITGLEMGADDYLVKPFEMKELMARIKALLRRSGSTPEEGNKDYNVGKLYVSPSRHQVKVDGNEVSLTLKEFELLCFLLENDGMVLTRDKILARIWGYDFDGETRTVDVHVRTLRQKLGECGSLIETVRGVGYKIDRRG